MAQSVFRKKSLEQMNNPESLNDIIRVSNPGIWLLLVSVAVLLVGSIVWAAFGTIESTVTADVHVENGQILCFMDEADMARVQVGMTVRIDEALGSVTAVGEETEHGAACIATMDETPRDGYYSGVIVLDSVKPITFILN